MKQSEKDRIEDACSMLARKVLIEILEDQLCIACFDDESTGLLRECLVEHMTGDDSYPEVMLEDFGPFDTLSLAYTHGVLP